jgi:succinoglycan biosynthesis transport protein ExoP
MNKAQYKDDAFSNLIEIIAARKLVAIIGFLAVFTTCIIGSFLIPSLYSASTKIYITLPTVPSAEIPYLSELRNFRLFFANQPQVIRSRRIFGEVVNQLHLDQVTHTPSLKRRAKDKIYQTLGIDQIKQDPFEEAIEDLHMSTSVSVARGTNIITIAAASKSSEGAAMLANTLSNVYIEYANHLMSDKARNAFNFIADKREVTRIELDKAQTRLERFQKENDIVLAESLVDKRARAQDKLTELYSNEQRIIDEISQAEDRLSSGKTNVGSVDIYQIRPDDSTEIIELKTQLNSMESELTALLKRYSSKYPDVIRLRGEVTRVKKALSLNPDDDVDAHTQLVDMKNSLVKKRNKIAKKIKILEGELSAITVDAIELAKLTRNMVVKEQEYAMLGATMENAAVFLKGGEIEVGSIQILEAAHPPLYPDKKKKKIFLLVGFLVSIVFGLGMAFIAEYRDNTFHDSDDVLNYLSLPFLASIPNVHKRMKKR